MSDDDAANHAAIKKLLDEVVEDIQWITSAEGLAMIDDKGIKQVGALRCIIIDILHRANTEGFDLRRLILSAVLGFAAECGTDSKEWALLNDIIALNEFAKLKKKARR